MSKTGVREHYREGLMDNSRQCSIMEAKGGENFPEREVP